MIFTSFFIEFINIGSMYIKAGWVVEKARKSNKMIQIVDLRVAVMHIFTHKMPIFHYKAWTDMH